MDTAQSSELFNEPRQVNYGMLKVLTVLTFIGCGLSYIGLLINATRWNSFEADIAKLEDMQEKMGNSGLFSFLQGSVEVAKKSYEHRYVLFATGLVFTTMCLIGAIQMRKLKKSGYPIYMFGELAPLVVMAILIGTGFSFYIAACLAVLFAILYTTQRQHLVR